MSTYPTAAGHEIVWQFEQDMVRGTAICNEPEGGDCKITCAEGCEEWTIERYADGRAYHRPYDDANTVHDMIPMPDGGCNVVLYLNDDWSLLPELGTGRFTIGRTPIDVEWQAPGYDWSQAELGDDIAADIAADREAER